MADSELRERKPNKPAEAGAATAAADKPKSKPSSDRAPPPEPLYQQVILVGLVVLFAGVSFKVITDPHSVLWLEDYLDFWSPPAAPSSPDVVRLDNVSFHTALKDKGGFLVEFYAPWCGHCKAFSPEYSKAASALVGTVKVGAIDGAEHKELMTQYGGRGFPSVVLLSGGAHTEYTGPRESESLVTWATRRVQGLPSMTSPNQITEVGEGDPTTVVAVFPSAATDATARLRERFLRAALDDNDREYATLEGDDAARAVCGGAVPCVLLRSPLRPGDNSVTWLWKVEPRHSDELEALQEFVGVEEFPTVVDFKPDRARMVLGAWHNTTAWLFAPAGSELSAWFATFAAERLGKALFARVESDAGLRKIIGLDNTLEPCFGLTRRKAIASKRVWKFPLELTLAAGDEGDEQHAASLDAAKAEIARHFDEVVAGKKPKLKSEKPPEDNSAPLKVVTGDTVGAFLSGDSDLFLKVYAPWCGHCKKMSPAWTELAEFYAGDNGVTVAKMDGTANEAEAFEVQGYPTLLYFRAGGGEPERYRGKRNVEALKEFVEATRTKKK